MAEESNPKKTTAPGSDNAEGRGGSPVEAQPNWDKDFLEAFEKQKAIQEKQAKTLEELSERLLSTTRSASDAEKKLFQEQSKREEDRDEEAIAAAEKQFHVQMELLRMHQTKFDDFQGEMKKSQEDMDLVIDYLGESVGKNDLYVKRMLKISDDANSIIRDQTEANLEATAKIGNEFRQFIDEFKVQQEAERAFDEVENKKLTDQIAASVMPDLGGTETERIAAIMQKTSLNLESLAVINEKIADEMVAEGVDTDDKGAVERFKMEKVLDTKFNESIIKELVKSRDSIKKETVQKELQEKYLRQGIPANLAAIKAEKNAEEETKKRRAEAAEQIRIFKSLDERQRYQTTLAEADYRARIEKAKEEDGLPEWYLRLEKTLSPINAALEDLKSAFSQSGIFTKVLMVLALLGGIIVGAIVTAVKKVIDIFRTGGIIAEWFASIRKSVPFINTMANTIGKMITWLKEGNAVGRFFVSVVTKAVTMFKELAVGLRVLETAGKEGGMVMKFLAAAVRPLVNIMKAFQYGFSIGAGAVNILSKALSFLSPVLKFLGKLFLPLTILLTAIDGIIGAFKGFSKDGIKGLIVGFFANILSGLTFGLVKFETIYNFFNDTIGAVVDGFKWVYEKVSGFVMDAVMYWWNGVTKFYDAIWSGIKWVYDKAKSFVMTAVKYWWSGVTGFYGAIWNGIKWVYDKVTGFAMKAVEKWWDTTKALYGAIWGGIKWAYNKVTGFASKSASFISDMAGAIFDSVKNVFSTIGNAMTDLGEKILTIVPEMINYIISEIEGFFNSIWDGIKSMAGWVGSWLGLGDAEKPTSRISESMEESRKNLQQASQNDSNNLLGAQKERDATAAASTGSQTQVNTTTTVNNVGGGGGKAPPATIIAPQPPRNTEPTLRTMQFGEQPAF